MSYTDVIVRIKLDLGDSLSQLETLERKMNQVFNTSEKVRENISKTVNDNFNKTPKGNSQKNSSNDYGLKKNDNSFADSLTTSLKSLDIVTNGLILTSSSLDNNLSNLDTKIGNSSKNISSNKESSNELPLYGKRGDGKSSDLVASSNSKETSSIFTYVGNILNDLFNNFINLQDGILETTRGFVNFQSFLDKLPRFIENSFSNPPLGNSRNNIKGNALPIETPRKDNSYSKDQSSIFSYLGNFLNELFSNFTGLQDGILETKHGFINFHEFLENLVKVVENIINNFYQGGAKRIGENGKPISRNSKLVSETSKLPSASKKFASEGKDEKSEEVVNFRANLYKASNGLNDYVKSLVNAKDTLANSFKNLGDAFSSLGSNLQGITSSIGSFVSIIGSSSLLENYINMASERQTNKMMLYAKAQEPNSSLNPDEYYNAINQKVIELPGNDQFLNQILTQIAVMDDFTTAEIEDMADIIANYYMLARAKGQLNFETEKEIRNYVLTGNTKGLQNSVLSEELGQLKNANGIKERTIALEKAMQDIHMDGLAKYESYTNSMETFVGHLQKASADIGEYIIAVLTPALRLYNAIDDMTFEGLSGSILIFLTAIVGSIGALTFFGKILTTIPSLVNNSVIALNSFYNITSSLSNVGGLLSTIKSEFKGLVETTRLLDSTSGVIPKLLSGLTGIDTAGSVKSLYAKAMATRDLTKADFELYEMMMGLSIGSAISQEETWGEISAWKRATAALRGLSLEQKEYLMTMYNVNEEELYQIFLENASTTAKTENAAATEWSTASILKRTLVNAKDVIVSNLSTLAHIRSTWATIADANATDLDTMAKNGNLITRALVRIHAYYEATSNFLNALSLDNEARATEMNTLAKDSNILAKIYSVFHTTVESAARFNEALAEYNEAVATGTNTAAKETNIFVKIYVSINSFLESINRTLVAATATEETVATDFNTVSKQGNVRAKIADIIASIKDIAVGIKDIAVTTAKTVAQALFNTELWITIGGLMVANIHIVVIIGVVLVLIGVIYKVGESFGWWSNIFEVFEAISSGLHRLWDAFMDSEPVARVIDYFSDFFDTIYSFFSLMSVVNILEGLFAVFNGTFDNPPEEGEWDIVGDIINLFEGLGDVLIRVYDGLANFFDNNPIGMMISWISPLGILLFHLDEIGAILEWIMLQWNAFFDSAEMQDLKDEFADIRGIFGEVFEVIWEAFSEIGEAIGEVISALFGETDDSNAIMDSLENSDWLLDTLRAIAIVIRDYVVPVIRGFAEEVRKIAYVIKTVAGVIANVIRFFGRIGEVFDKISGKLNDLGNAIVNEFVSIPGRIIGAITDIPGKVFGGLVDGVLNILGIHSPGYIQEAVVNEFLAIPSRILGGVSDVIGAVGSFAGSIINTFTSLFGVDISNTVDEFLKGVTDGFDKLVDGDAVGSIKSFTDGVFAPLEDLTGVEISDKINGALDFVAAGKAFGSIGNYVKSWTAPLDSLLGTNITGTVDEFTNEMDSSMRKLFDGDLLGSIGDFANAIWTPFDDLFGTDVGVQVDGFINRLSTSFKKLGEGDVIGAINDFGNNLLTTLDNIFNTDVSGMVKGFVNHMYTSMQKLMNGDIIGVVTDNLDYLNDSINRFTGIDIGGTINNVGEGIGNVWNSMINPHEKLQEKMDEIQNASPNDLKMLSSVLGHEVSKEELTSLASGSVDLLRSTGLMQNPNNLTTTQNLAQNYNTNTTNAPTIIHNNFSEGSVKADARNMSDRDVQKMFTSAFGYNKSRGVRGILS